MNKKLIISIVIFIMIFSSFIVLFNYNNVNSENNINIKRNNVIPFEVAPSFISNTIPIIVKNYTIPQVNYNISTTNGAMTDYFLTKYSPTHTLTYYYYSTSGTIDEYIFNTGQVISLGSAPKPWGYAFIGYFYPNQLVNLSVSGFGYVSNDNNFVEFNYYNLYNNTLNSYVSNISISLTHSNPTFNVGDNYFYFSSLTSGILNNIWVNMTTYKYYYLNYSAPDWNSISYFNAGKAWLFTSNNPTLNNVNYTVMTYSSSSNSFVKTIVISNTLSAITGADNNFDPIIQSKFSNNTILLSALGNIAGADTSENIYLYYYTNDTYKLIVSTNAYDTLFTTDGSDDIFYSQNNYYIAGQNFGNNATFQNAFTNIYNKTVLLTNNSWFNNYFTTTLIGYRSGLNTSNVYIEGYFGYSGWENALLNNGNNTIMLWYNPNKVNEFAPSNTSFENSIKRYKLTINENGLPLSTQWTYNFNGTSYTLTNNSYNYSLVNGNYTLSVSSVNGYNVAYPSTITIDNASKIAYVNFTAIPKYSVTIQENGLPTDTQWNFTIKHSGTTVIAETLATSSYTTLLQNDTYDLYAGTVSGYNLHIHTSPFTVSGSAITEYVNYTAIPTYTLFLKETGLASGTTWIAYVGSTQYSSSNAYINVTGLVNGTYSLSIDNVADYSLGSYPTSFTISGSNYYINVTFTHNTTLHSVKIIAEHIANVNSITWSVVFNGTTYSSQNSNTIIIPSLKNGTYSFSVNAISGYVIDKYPSSLTIDGANITQYIYFNETFSISIVVSGYLGQYTYVFNGTAHSISGNTVINGLVNYTYSFSVNAISGYTITYNSSIIISGKDVTENVTFTAVVTKTGEYIVEFIITGLAPHTTWSVTVNGQEYISNTYELNITLVNGTYFPDITTPNNYVLNDQPALVVAGSNTVYYISASPTTFGSFVQYMPYFLVFVFIIGMLALVIAVRRR